ncbi:MAG: hypothetical protein K2H53_00140 [Clostridia bacterium]|nr:hypothetical protein [Clostridia bacterium]
MAIGAKDKFEWAIFNRIREYKMISQRKITDLEELETIMETATGRGYSLSMLKNLYRLVETSAEEYTYENGLKYLISEIKIDNGTDIHTIKQETLTSDYKAVPIVNIVVEGQRKSVNQFLISSSPKDETIPEAMKDIEVEKTMIYVNNTYGSHFETYTYLNDLMVEKYKQYSPISYYKNSINSLIRLCGHGTRCLEIIYREGKPIYAQLSDKYKVEMAGYDPNSPKDVATIVSIINGEVNAIVDKIHSSIDDYEKKESFTKGLKWRG